MWLQRKHWESDAWLQQNIHQVSCCHPAAFDKTLQNATSIDMQCCCHCILLTGTGWWTLQEHILSASPLQSLVISYFFPSLPSVRRSWSPRSWRAVSESPSASQSCHAYDDCNKTSAVHNKMWTRHGLCGSHLTPQLRYTLPLSSVMMGICISQVADSKASWMTKHPFLSWKMRTRHDLTVARTRGGL